MGFPSLFVGKMLGDGYMNCTHKAPRFCFVHTLADRAYAEYCFQLLLPYLPFGPNGLKETSYFDPRTQKTYYRIFCQSRSSPLLRSLYSLWYQRQKVLPIEWVGENINAESLALWFQDDGNLKKGGDRIILSTESFSLKERMFLQYILQKRFGVLATIDCQGRLDISSRHEVRKFQALVEPLMHDSMAKKSIVDKWKSWKARWEESRALQGKPHRTSIYLPYYLYDKLRGLRYSDAINRLMDAWMDKQWHQYLLEPDKRYHWLRDGEAFIEKGAHLLTPSFRADVKIRLDILSDATGFERSELVMMALCEGVSIML
ncbi:endonuclease [Neomoorella thermoacetica]|uniref:endonuclease n=1 Tax=Neomoorella thermoacetica TaxID=1525 RepID=UPI0008FB1D1A|nr:endonuclease [Moorella thermoacetica]OIQ60532.1 LAGLIDADG DNA endonuclease family protein [Moorella thermoacetica]